MCMTFAFLQSSEISGPIDLCVLRPCKRLQTSLPSTTGRSKHVLSLPLDRGLASSYSGKDRGKEGSETSALSTLLVTSFPALLINGPISALFCLLLTYTKNPIVLDGFDQFQC